MKKITHLASLIFLSMFFVSLNAQQTNTLCQPTVASGYTQYGIFITNVTTTGAQTNLSNTGTGFETGINADFRSQILSAYQGDVVTITVEPQGSNASHVGVYIDSDNDGNYSASEIVGSATGVVSGLPATITFTVPSVNGDFNLRTILGYDTTSTYSFTDGCTMNNTLAGGLGESEDYTLRISDVPSCGSPTGLTATAGFESGYFAWNHGVNNDSYSWELFIGTETGATPYDSGTTTSTSDSTNYPLTANTLYTVVLTASCTGTPVTPLSTTFTTPCAAQALPYSNSFETDLTCFTNSSSTPWQIGTAGSQGIMPPSGSDGDYYVYFADYDYSNGSTADLVTPRIDMSSSTSATLTFDYIDPDTFSSAYNGDTVGVYVIDASGTYNLVFTTDASVSGWTTQTVDLSSYAGQIIQIAFRGTSVYGYSNPSIDNLSVAEPSACAAPTITSASASSTTSASVEWTNDSTSSSNDVYVTTSTDSPDSLTAATITDATSPQSLTGLTANTTYYVYVRSQCTSGETSDWSSVSSFTTLCNATTSGFSQNFNGLSALPSCWSVVNGGGSTTWGMHSSGAVFIGYESAAHDDYLKSPTFTVIDGVTDGFSFQASSPDLSYPEQIDVIVEDLTAGTSTIIADNYYPETPVASSVVYLSTFYDLSAYEGSDVRISFHSTTQDMFRLYFDNFVVGSAATMAAGWAGFTSTSYSNAQNWYAGSVPTGDVTLNLNSDSASNSPTIDSAVSASSLTVDTGVSLTISESGSLQTTGDFTNSGTVTMNSTATAHSSLIVGGSSTGSITYNRYADVDRWYITSSPVSGQDIDTFISNEDLAISTNSEILVGLGDYNNDGSQYPADPTITTGWWDYHQSAQSDSGDFTSGKGKIVRLASDATDNLLGFTGTISGSVSVPMTVATTAFNLIGNPYPAAVQVTSQGGATNDALSANSSVLSEETAWFWNGAENGYTAVNQNPSQAAKITAPGQGFFVSAAGSGDFSFTTAMQTTSAGSFNRQTEWSKIDLSMSAGSQSSETEIVYFDGATTGWDNGYDSTNWSSGSFQIFTSHVDTSTSQNLAIQSLPLGNFNDMVVPVGVNASAGQTITISVDTTNWPEGVKIYLEDVDNDSYTLLDGQNAEFTTLLDSNESGIGRFYIHTTSNSLGDDDLTLTDVSIYASSRDNLRILGINSGEANVQMFDLMGKQVLNTSFNGQSVNDVKLPNLNTGIYLVNLASDEGTINKKIIIQ